MKLSWRQNSLKCSRADCVVSVWSFSYFSGNDSVPIFRVLLVDWFYEATSNTFQGRSESLQRRYNLHLLSAREYFVETKLCWFSILLFVLANYSCRYSQFHQNRISKLQSKYVICFRVKIDASNWRLPLFHSTGVLSDSDYYYGVKMVGAWIWTITVIPRLTSDSANEFFG